MRAKTSHEHLVICACKPWQKTELYWPSSALLSSLCFLIMRSGLDCFRRFDFEAALLPKIGDSAKSGDSAAWGRSSPPEVEYEDDGEIPPDNWERDDCKYSYNPLQRIRHQRKSAYHWLKFFNPFITFFLLFFTFAVHSFFLTRICFFLLRLSVPISTVIWGSNCSWDVLIFPITSLYRNALLSVFLTQIVYWMDMRSKISIINISNFIIRVIEINCYN